MTQSRALRRTLSKPVFGFLHVPLLGWRKPWRSCEQRRQNPCVGARTTGIYALAVIVPTCINNLRHGHGCIGALLLAARAGPLAAPQEQ